MQLHNSAAISGCKVASREDFSPGVCVDVIGQSGVSRPAIGGQFFSRLSSPAIASTTHMVCLGRHLTMSYLCLLCCAVLCCVLQGFPMKQGVLTNGRVQLLMSPGDQVRGAT
jgi:hypothetical protein